MRMRPTIIVVPLLAATALLPSSSPARGDYLLLHSGARVEGQWVNHDAFAAESYVMVTSDGVRLTLDRGQVKQAVRQSPDETEYERLASAADDTVDTHWKLVAWCREHHLPSQARAHLRRIVEIDAGQSAAWRALGYTRKNDQWVTQRQWQEEQGYVFYRGRWRTSQEVELLEAKRKIELAEREWAKRLKALRAGLYGKGAQEAYTELIAIRDPLAVRSLAAAYQKEDIPAVRSAYVGVLGQIESTAALATLMTISLDDPHPDLRDAALGQVVPRKTPSVVEAYVRRLKDPNNVRVNRAATALARLDEPSAIGPLIEALITVHEVQQGKTLYRRTSSPGATNVKYTVVHSSPPVGLPPDAVTGPSTSFAPGSQADTVLVPVFNQDVLSALVKLSGGVSYGFDQPTWRTWHNVQRQQQQTEEINARRDSP